MKRHHILLTMLLAASLLTGCSGSSTMTVLSVPDGTQTTTPANPPRQAASVSYPLTICVGYSTNADDPRGIALASFQEEVESKSGGNLLIEIHPDGELGSDSELIAGMISKDVDMTVSSAGNYALYATRIGVSALPFLFEDFDSAWEFIDSPLMQTLSSDLEVYNMHVLAYFDNGFRCVTTSAKVGPVEAVSDMKGLNIRTPENQIVMETMSRLSANPRSYPFAELKAALKDGTFDAQENPIPVIYNHKLYEVQKYLSITNHSYDAMPLTIRQDLWDSLTPEYQQIISEAAKNAEFQNRKLVKRQTDECVQKLEDAGMEIVYPDLSPFREATTGVKDMFAAVYGQDLIDYIEKISADPAE
ncbi:MAG: TRAP transporter substrate-binding protein [Oscillospiraceae bacterium]|nr:TRAP transporter substrate-binding protein [Oscillospiraceae bacterium]